MDCADGDDSTERPIADYTAVTEFERLVAVLGRCIGGKKGSFTFRQCQFELISFEAARSPFGDIPHHRFAYSDDVAQTAARAFDLESFTYIKCADERRVVSDSTARLFLSALICAGGGSGKSGAFAVLFGENSLMAYHRFRMLLLERPAFTTSSVSDSTSQPACITLRCQADGEIYEWHSIWPSQSDEQRDAFAAPIQGVRLLSANIPHTALKTSGALQTVYRLQTQAETLPKDGSDNRALNLHSKVWHFKSDKVKRHVAFPEDSTKVELRLAGCLLRIFEPEHKGIIQTIAKLYSADDDALHELCHFWLLTFVPYLRDKWEDKRSIYHCAAHDERAFDALAVDLGAPLLVQKLQLLDCCIRWAQLQQSEEHFFDVLEDDGLAREGHLRPLGGGAKMLDSGKDIYVPVTQNIGPMTSDWIEIHREAIERVPQEGDDPVHRARARLQSKQLTSDMQAFKAANPGCSLTDFVRWHSPRDFEDDVLSDRMQEPGNLWAELWSEAEACPVSRQARLFNCQREAESALWWIEDISVHDLLRDMHSSVHHVAACRVQSSPDYADIFEHEKTLVLHDIILRSHLGIPLSVPGSLLEEYDRIVSHLSTYSDAIRVDDARAITAFKQFLTKKARQKDLIEERFSESTYERISNGIVAFTGRVE